MNYKDTMLLWTDRIADAIETIGSVQYLWFRPVAGWEPNKDSASWRIRRVVTVSPTQTYVDYPYDIVKFKLHEAYNLIWSEKDTLASNPNLVWLPDANYF